MADIKVDGLPFTEAIKFIQNKLVIPSRQWRDLVGPVHSKAFTVAGAAKLAIATDFYNAVNQVIESGGTLNDFRKEFDRIVDKHGWSYNGKRGWRTRVIFQTNKITAYMAGKWEQLWRMREYRPYLQYMTVGDERVRQSHMKWHLKVIRIDHPIWRLIYPPNDWLCRCGVRSLSQDDMEEEGLTESTVEMPRRSDTLDPETGEVTREYDGIGFGWDYNVGMEWLGPEKAFGQQLMEVPADLRQAALNNIDLNHFENPFKRFSNKVAYQVVKGKTDIDSGAIGVGYFNNIVINELADELRYPTNAAVAIRDQSIAEMLNGAPGQSIALSSINRIPAILRNPDAVLYNQSTQSLVYAKLGDNGYLAFSVTIAGQGELNYVESAFTVSGTELINGPYLLLFGSLAGAN